MYRRTELGMDRLRRRARHGRSACRIQFGGRVQSLGEGQTRVSLVDSCSATGRKRGRPPRDRILPSPWRWCPSRPRPAADSSTRKPFAFSKPHHSGAMKPDITWQPFCSRPHRVLGNVPFSCCSRRTPTTTFRRLPHYWRSSQTPRLRVCCCRRGLARSLGSRACKLHR